MHPIEPHWRTNSSFSPSISRRWDCRFQSDGLSNGAPLYGSSISSSSKGSRSRVRSDEYPDHHHSVLDGVLSYFGSPTDSLPAPQWTQTVQKLNFPEFATLSVGGSRLENPLFPSCTERNFTAGVSVSSNSFESPSLFSESGFWDSLSKPTISFPLHNISGRRSFNSKPVYPLVFHNPISDAEGGIADVISASGLIPDENRTLPFCSDDTSVLNLKFRKTSKLQKMEDPTDPSASSMKEAFRWSNANIYDMSFDGEGIDIPGQVDLDNTKTPFYSTNDQKCANDQKCGLCGRLLCQKSPWSSYRIVRSGDMPVAGVLSCSHIFHAECLEQTTPKTQLNDPPCPLCLKITGQAESSSTVSEPLKMALRSVCRNHGINIADDATGENGNQHLDRIEYGLKRNRFHPMSGRGSNSMIKNQIRKRFSFKGKLSKELIGPNLFRQTGLSHSDQRASKSSVGCSKTGQST